MNLFYSIVLLTLAFNSVRPNPTKTVASRGKYYWELIFNYVNSDNVQIEELIEIREKWTVNKKDFIREKLNVNFGYSYNQQTSFSMKYLSTVQLEGSSSFALNLHEEVAKELVTERERFESYEKEVIHKRKYVIGSNGRLSLYRLCYVSDGTVVKSNIVSTDPNLEEVIVSVNYSVTPRILGLRDIENVLANTRPNNYNIFHWNDIRNTIVSSFNQDEETRLKNLVVEMGKVNPKNANKGEWAEIRATCSEILREWNSVDMKQLSLNKLLFRLSLIKPKNTNVWEWSVIRDMANKIRNSLAEKLTTFN